MASEVATGARCIVAYRRGPWCDVANKWRRWPQVANASSALIALRALRQAFFSSINQLYRVSRGDAFDCAANAYI